MSFRHDDSNDNPLGTLVSRLALLSFGLAVLAFLVAIEHQNWFTLKPASGTAAAMFYASDAADKS